MEISDIIVECAHVAVRIEGKTTMVIESQSGGNFRYKVDYQALFVWGDARDTQYPVVQAARIPFIGVVSQVTIPHKGIVALDDTVPIAPFFELEAHEDSTINVNAYPCSIRTVRIRAHAGATVNIHGDKLVAKNLDIDVGRKGSVRANLTVTDDVALSGAKDTVIDGIHALPKTKFSGHTWGVLDVVGADVSKLRSITRRD